MQEFDRESIQDYYGKVLSSTKDLKTDACCSAELMPSYLKSLVSNIHPEVLERFYGCGSPIPLALEAKTVLDLGSGSGRDCYLLSQLVGENGKVIGVDMTDEQLVVAKRHLEYHREKFQYKNTNVTFKKGLIEDLASLGIEDNSIDVVTSNCVINLSPEKPQVFKEIFRVLKPGGELYFSDIFASRRIPKYLQSDEILLGECLSGAMYIEDFRRLLAELGCNDYRVVQSSKLNITNAKISEKLAGIEFYSMTVRAFNLNLEDRCEDYGQVAKYKGNLAFAPVSFKLDDHHDFAANRPVLVCGNTARMLGQTRFAEYFDVIGDESHHLGLFECDSSPSFSAPCC